MTYRHLPLQAAEAAAKCEKERNWRFGYNRHLMKLVRLGCESPKGAAGSAQVCTGCDGPCDGCNGM